MKGLLTESKAAKLLQWTIDNADPDNQDQVQLIYDETMRVKPKVAIELGVRRGVSTRAILAAMAQYGGTLYSVDNDKQWEKVYGEIVGADPELANWWELWIDESLNFARGWKHGAVELLFIDTSHEFDQTVEELEAYMPLLAKGGSAMFHDTCNRYSTGVVIPIINYMKRRTDLEYKELGGKEGLGRLRRV